MPPKTPPANQQAFSIYEGIYVTYNSHNNSMWVQWTKWVSITFYLVTGALWEELLQGPGSREKEPIKLGCIRLHCCRALSCTDIHNFICVPQLVLGGFWDCKGQIFLKPLIEKDKLLVSIILECNDSLTNFFLLDPTNLEINRSWII